MALTPGQSHALDDLRDVAQRTAVLSGGLHPVLVYALLQCAREGVSVPAVEDVLATAALRARISASIPA